MTGQDWYRWQKEAWMHIKWLNEGYEIDIVTGLRV